MKLTEICTWHYIIESVSKCQSCNGENKECEFYIPFQDRIPEAEVIKRYHEILEKSLREMYGKKKKM